MKWNRVGNSDDVIDARGDGGGGGGGFGGLPIGRAGGGLGIGGILIYLAIQLLGGGSASSFGVNDPISGTSQAPVSRPILASQDPDRDLKDFSVYVFTRVQKTWEQ